MVQLAIDKGIIASRSDLTPVNSATVYDYAYPELLHQLYVTIPPRPADININTLANRSYIRRVVVDEVVN